MCGNNNSFLRHVADYTLPPIAWLLCKTLGILTWVFTARRTSTLRNVALAFPDKDLRWQKRIAFNSIVRMFEMFAVPTVTPWLSENNLRRRFHFTPQAIGILEKIKDGHPAIMQTPHCASTESLTIAPMIYPGIKFTSVYRPLDIKLAEKYVLWSRSHWGMKLVSRKEGLLGISHALGKGECVCILFDQNTLTSGALILGFGRLCFATDLPGILAYRLHKPTYLVHAKRTGFLRAAFEISEIETDGSAAEITAGTNLMLEKVLRSDEEACADWMWAHRRWKNDLCRVNHCLSIEHRKDYLAASMKLAAITELPRRQPYILRLPSDSERARIVAGWMPRLRAARPDVRWIVVANDETSGLFREGENCERLVVCKDAKLNSTLQTLRNEWAEIYMTLEPESDVLRESSKCGTPRAMGISSKIDRNKNGVTIFKAEEAKFSPDRFNELLDDVFKSCGLGM